MVVIAEQLNHLVQARYHRWKSADLPGSIRRELKNLKSSEITDRFYTYLNFGTQGMLGKIGAGTNRMNKYTVGWVTCAFALDLLEHVHLARQRGVVIGYDSRQYSKEFAEHSALVLAEMGVNVYMFQETRPTPQLSFAIRWLHAAAGVMITAGNHSSDYNGLKILTEDGTPMQQTMADRMMQVLEGKENELVIPVMELELAKESGRLKFIDGELDEAYEQSLRFAGFSHEPNFISAPIKVLYNPLQGKGGDVVCRALSSMGFTEIRELPERLRPNPYFFQMNSLDLDDPAMMEPTLEMARTYRVDLVLITNVETNELNLLVRDYRNGTYVSLSGNQLGALMLDYLCSGRTRRGLLPPNGVAVKTVLTTELAASIAESYDVGLVNTLHGFKHIAAKMAYYEKTAKQSFIFGFDEAGGFVAPGFVRDKDAAQASMLLTEMAGYYKARDLSLLDRLEQLYEQHGYFAEDRIMIRFSGLEGLLQIRNVMDRLGDEYPSVLGGLKIRWICNFNRGEMRKYSRGRLTPAEIPKADLLKFIFEDDSWYAIRPSASDTVLKLYFGSRGETRAECRDKLARIRSEVLYTVESII
ncbi:phospho-sugar mutase [Marinicrinis lubricantis]|uniref:Phospho-sugar mutase n=1 Tax=Marinicrinis lubricantis TaxID=2086470 RepID=A0ABW1IJV2_9BACL